jgi:hypothetical protein
MNTIRGPDNAALSNPGVGNPPRPPFAIGGSEFVSSTCKRERSGPLEFARPIYPDLSLKKRLRRIPLSEIPPLSTDKLVVADMTTLLGFKWPHAKTNPLPCRLRHQ